EERTRPDLRVRSMTVASQPGRVVVIANVLGLAVTASRGVRIRGVDDDRGPGDCRRRSRGRAGGTRAEHKQESPPFQIGGSVAIARWAFHAFDSTDSGTPRE